MRAGNGDMEESNLDPDEERLYEIARGLEFGDYNVCRLSDSPGIVAFANCYSIM